MPFHWDWIIYHWMLLDNLIPTDKDIEDSSQFFFEFKPRVYFFILMSYKLQKCGLIILTLTGKLPNSMGKPAKSVEFPWTKLAQPWVKSCAYAAIRLLKNSQSLFAKILNNWNILGLVFLSIIHFWEVALLSFFWVSAVIIWLPSIGLFLITAKESAMNRFQKGFLQKRENLVAGLLWSSFRGSKNKCRCKNN